MNMCLKHGHSDWYDFLNSNLLRSILLKEKHGTKKKETKSMTFIVANLIRLRLSIPADVFFSDLKLLFY